MLYFNMAELYLQQWNDNAASRYADKSFATEQHKAVSNMHTIYTVVKAPNQCC